MGPRQDHKQRKLTDSVARHAKPRASVYELDADGAGLKLRVTPNASKAWTLRYRTRAGARRRHTLGKYPDLALKDARNEAAALRDGIRRGIDPNAEHERHRRTPTMGEARELYLDAIIVAPRTLSTYRQRLTKHVPTMWLGRPLPEVTVADVRALHRKITRAGTPVAANRVVESLRALFGWAKAEWPDLGLKNPARFEKQGPLRRNAETLRSETINQDERELLLRTLATAEARPPRTRGCIARSYARAIRLILFTGMRPVDVVTLRHDLIQRVVSAKNQDLWIVRWPASGRAQTKKANQTRVLNSSAIDLVLEQAGDFGTDGWVFPNAAGRRSSSNQLARSFRRIREEAGLPASVGLYVAGRHTYISAGVMAGIPLAVMGRDVDNASAVSRYAHLEEAAEQVSEQVLAVLCDETTRGAR